MHKSSSGGPGPCCLSDAGSLNGPQTSPGWGLKAGLCSAPILPPRFEDSPWGLDSC